MITRIGNLALGLCVLPGLLVSRRRRSQFARMRGFLSVLADRFDGPLPAAMSTLDADMEAATLPEASTRRLADVAALVARRSPLGLCLRRSLTRHHFLTPAGLPITVHFGARLAADQKGDDDARTLTGHAWTVVGGRAYHERARDYAGFATILVWPDRSEPARTGA